MTGPLLVNMMKAYCPHEKTLDKLVRDDELISREASLHLDALRASSALQEKLITIAKP